MINLPSITEIAQAAPGTARRGSNQPGKTPSSPRKASELRAHPSPRRGVTKMHSNLMVPNDVADRALSKLGVSEETLRIEKLMKKLGVCDHDLEEYDDLQRHSAVLELSIDQLTKEELLCGYSKKQMLRAKAVRSLGTSEEEIIDDHAQRVSGLGAQSSATPRNLSPRLRQYEYPFPFL
ncbi:hypothetical protein H257_00682 [Aphanomyces astaci]|uniref:Uncharacterized protein n=1 Tax=Aphanomyces astaci TaxID=112090 RepID=W4HBR3_APHAT|nr:hypothetical protein H257_00682 [Aphanomyces astaci]ETV89377.1 hypothetical protein H257_00682 [Aphanomyces astaci]|eukprot:XP_009821777.1 hypothetical protein H257_00682 [Aphanomyces astaci]